MNETVKKHEKNLPQTMEPKEKSTGDIAEKETEIESASDFQQLYETLRKKGKIIGSNGKEYSAEDLIQRIEAIKESIAYYSPEWIAGYFPGNSTEDSPLLVSITRNEGLRKKVGELILEQRGLIERPKKTKEE